MSGLGVLDPAADGSDATEMTLEQLRSRIAELERALGRHEQNASVTPGTAAAARRLVWVEAAIEDLRRLGHHDLAAQLEVRERYSPRNIRLLPETEAR